MNNGYGVIYEIPRLLPEEKNRIAVLPILREQIQCPKEVFLWNFELSFYYIHKEKTFISISEDQGNLISPRYTIMPQKPRPSRNDSGILINFIPMQNEAWIQNGMVKRFNFHKI